MAKSDIRVTATFDLARLLQMDADRSDVWQADDLSAILRHQLATPLIADLSDDEPRISELLAGARSAGQEPLETFGDLLRHPSPPIELLEMFKRFAKTSGAELDGPLPREVSAVLYLAAIAAALLRFRSRITDADDRLLCDKLRWALAHPWLSSETRGLFEAGLDQVARSDDPE